MSSVIVVVGAGSIGQAIARRLSAGKHIILADLRIEAADAGARDEVGTVGALMMGPDGAFITGSDFLMDGGVTASLFY